MYIAFTSLLGFLWWSHSQSMTSQRAFFTSYLSFSTQLIPAPSLVSAFFVKLGFLFRLQWLSPPAQRDIVLSDSAQIFNKRWVMVSDTLSKLVGGKASDYRLWSHTCETEPQPLATVPQCWRWSPRTREPLVIANALKGFSADVHVIELKHMC